MSKPIRIAARTPLPDPTVDAAAAAVDEADLLAVSAARIEHRLRLLDELAEMAMKLARDVTEQGLAAKAAAAETSQNAASPTQAPPRDTADDFAKLSRAVRITLDLAGRLEETLRRLRAGEAAVRETRRKEREARANRAVIDRCDAMRSKVAEQVTMVIQREAESEADSCDLLEALDERLEDDIAYVNVEMGPLREMVEKLCGDLGLSPDWSLWTEDGWPEPPEGFFVANRPPWSPFNRPSRKPLLYKNRDYDQREFDLIDRSP
jgi:hypothetical protein